MIIQIRGTSGSGKSSLVRRIIDHYDCNPFYKDRPNIPHHYKCYPENGRRNPFVLVGPYISPSGGLDVLGKEERRLANLYEFYKEQHDAILSEGIMQSEDVKWTSKLAEIMPIKIVSLNTPVNVCIKRIKKRRKEAGNFKPLNEKNTRSRYETIQRSLNRLKDVDNVSIYVCNSNVAYRLIMKWLGN